MEYLLRISVDPDPDFTDADKLEVEAIILSRLEQAFRMLYKDANVSEAKAQLFQSTYVNEIHGERY